MLKKIKNTLAILLAVCFVMSVTAAAVGAAPETAKPLPQHIVKPLPQHIIKHKSHLVKGHWETKLVKTIVKQKVFVHHHLKIVTKVVYKSIKVWVPAKWVV
jgi:hypothetical protein